MIFQPFDKHMPTPLPTFVFATPKIGSIFIPICQQFPLPRFVRHTVFPSSFKLNSEATYIYFTLFLLLKLRLAAAFFCKLLSYIY